MKATWVKWKKSVVAVFFKNTIQTSPGYQFHELTNYKTDQIVNFFSITSRHILVKSTAVAWRKKFKVLYLATAPLFSAFQYLTRKLICFSTCEDVVSFITNEYTARDVFTIFTLRSSMTELFFSTQSKLFAYNIWKH